MKERPILMTGVNVLAILAGAKTQTRRVIKPQPPSTVRGRPWCSEEDLRSSCPYGVPGDRLWVRETWRPWHDVDLFDVVQYRADLAIRKPEGLTEEQGYRFDAECEATTANVDGKDTAWRPSIYMPRWASRITLEITEVRVQRVRAITEEDARAEGVVPMVGLDLEGRKFRDGFWHLWDSINAKRGFSWEKNPFVWVIDFRVVK